MICTCINWFFLCDFCGIYITLRSSYSFLGCILFWSVSFSLKNRPNRFMPVRGFLIVAKNIVNTCVHIGSVIYIYMFLYTPPPPKNKINKNKNPAEILFTGRFYNFSFSILEISHVCIISFHHATSQQFPSAVFQHIVVTPSDYFSKTLKRKPHRQW